MMREMAAVKRTGATSPSRTNAVAVPIRSTIQPKFMPKKAVITVSGRKIVATRVSRSLAIRLCCVSASPRNA
jgi:hypothetical protein